MGIGFPHAFVDEESYLSLKYMGTGVYRNVIRNIKWRTVLSTREKYRIATNASPPEGVQRFSKMGDYSGEFLSSSSDSGSDSGSDSDSSRGM